MRQMWRYVLEYRWLCLSVFALGFAATVLLVLRTTTEFRVAASFQVFPLQGTNSPEAGPTFHDQIEDVVARLRSRQIASELRQTVVPPNAERYLTSADTIGAIQKRLETVHLDGSCCELRVTFPDPQRAATIANTALSIYAASLRFPRKESGGSPTPEIFVYSPADPVAAVVLPFSNRSYRLIAGILTSLIAGVGIAWARGATARELKRPEDIEDYLRLPFLGHVPTIRTSSIIERELQAHIDPGSFATHFFRNLRTVVSLTKNGDKLRIIAVTSAIPSEGKSLVASNFAIVTAQSGHRTLLVDADLRRPKVHKAFQLMSPIGLSAYLAGRVGSLDEIIHKTEVPNLDVICCGALPTNAVDLIASKQMLQFLGEVSAGYDRVVLDCPPASWLADPLVIGAICDGVIFVTKFNKIRREHALRTVQRIQDAGIYIIGSVLNDIDLLGKDSSFASAPLWTYSNYYSPAGSLYQSRTVAAAGVGNRDDNTPTR